MAMSQNGVPVARGIYRLHFSVVNPSSHGFVTIAQIKHLKLKFSDIVVFRPQDIDFFRSGLKDQLSLASVHVRFTKINALYGNIPASLHNPMGVS